MPSCPSTVYRSFWHQPFYTPRFNKVERGLYNLQAKVSATVRHFGGDSSHTPFFDCQGFQGNTLYPLAIIHMEHINVMDFDDKYERNLCFSFGNLGIIFNGASVQLFRPGRNGNSAGSGVTHQSMTAEINRCRMGAILVSCPLSLCPSVPLFVRLSVDKIMCALYLPLY